MNFIFISPNFPTIYSKFVHALKDNGVNVLGIGDTPYFDTNEELRKYITEYYYLTDLSNYEEMKKAVQYFIDKYGHIDFLESNNEYWLMEDAKLREYFHIDTGFYPANMDKIKYKSKMKQYFNKAGVKTARYILVSDLDKSLDFAKEVGYPLFVKPDNGVGASHSYKISNEEELRKFHNTKLETTYIMEEFIDGELMSFDGMCDIDGNVIFAVNEHFPTPIAEVVNDSKDIYYYATTEMPDKFRKLGENVVKAFGISKRCFHIEFFKLRKSKKGLGKKGDIIALETNMRSPGGNTPDLISLAINANYYKIYADVICYNKSLEDLNKEKYIAMSVARHDSKVYRNTHSDILNKYKDNIREVGVYPKGIREAMGDHFYFATFNDLKSANEFKDFVLKQ